MTEGNLGESVFWVTSPEGGALIIAESCSKQQAWQPSRILRDGILIGQHRAQSQLEVTEAWILKACPRNILSPARPHLLSLPKWHH